MHVQGKHVLETKAIKALSQRERKQFWIGQVKVCGGEIISLL